MIHQKNRNMKNLSPILIFDANIFLTGIDFHLFKGIIYTTPLIIEEVKVRKYKDKNRNIMNKIAAAILKKGDMTKQKSYQNLTRKRYDRLAFFYDFLEAPVERFKFATWRRRLLNRIDVERGERVLEIGVGTGKNIPYYPEGAKVTAIDLSSRMLERARKRATVLEASVAFHIMDVQHLAFPDRVFDPVFATFVFCSVPDPVAGLKELRRVCKPGGNSCSWNTCARKTRSSGSCLICSILWWCE